MAYFVNRAEAQNAIWTAGDSYAYFVNRTETLNAIWTTGDRYAYFVNRTDGFLQAVWSKADIIEGVYDNDAFNFEVPPPPPPPATGRRRAGVFSFLTWEV